MSDFVCEFEEYNEFLRDEALGLQEAEISKLHLLINKENADVIAFMSLSTDSIKLSNSEKDVHKTQNAYNLLDQVHISSTVTSSRLFS
ncbi:MAG: mS35 family ribosomal protein [Desulfitobacteriaceae bacterium]